MRPRKTKSIKPIHPMREKTYVMLFGIITILFTFYSLFNYNLIVPSIGLIVIGLTSLFMYIRYERKKHSPNKVLVISGLITMAIGILFILFS